MGEPDETLLQKFKNGDEEAFMEIMERYQQKIFNYFLRQLHDYTLSEDLTQDVFIRVYKYGQTFDHRKSFKPWVYRIALNVLRKELKYQTSENRSKKAHMSKNRPGVSLVPSREKTLDFSTSEAV